MSSTQQVREKGVSGGSSRQLGQRGRDTNASKIEVDNICLEVMRLGNMCLFLGPGLLLAHDDSGFVALKSGAQGSNVLSALANADAFAVVPVGEANVTAGEPVMLEMFTWDEDRTHNDD